MRIHACVPVPYSCAVLPVSNPCALCLRVCHHHKVVLTYLDSVTNVDTSRSFSRKLAPPLVTLLNSEPETQYVALRNINLIVQKRSGILESEIKVGFSARHRRGGGGGADGPRRGGWRVARARARVQTWSCLGRRGLSISGAGGGGMARVLKRGVVGESVRGDGAGLFPPRHYLPALLDCMRTFLRKR